MHVHEDAANAWALEFFHIAVDVDVVVAAVAAKPASCIALAQELPARLRTRRAAAVVVVVVAAVCWKREPPWPLALPQRHSRTCHWVPPQRRRCLLRAAAIRALPHARAAAEADDNCTHQRLPLRESCPVPKALRAAMILTRMLRQRWRCGDDYY